MFFTHVFKLQLHKALILVLFSSLVSLHAREGHGSWDRESKAEYTLKLVYMLKFEQEERLAQLQKQTPDLAPEIAYPNFEKYVELKEKFLQGRLSSKKGEGFVELLQNDLQTNQDLLYAAEAKAAKIWKTDGSQKKDSPKKHTAEIFGGSVTAIRLGVILDSSPSMRPFLPTLRKTIKEIFDYSYFVEIDGCRLSRYYGKMSNTLGKEAPRIMQRESLVCWFFADPGLDQNPFLPEWHSPPKLNWGRHPYSEYLGLKRSGISSILALSNLLKVDTIYWFSDFQDSVDERTLKVLLFNLKAHKITLHLHTYDNRPPKDLVKYAKDSGGSYKRKKIKIQRQ